jgi:hypothetical protein
LSARPNPTPGPEVIEDFEGGDFEGWEWFSGDVTATVEPGAAHDGQQGLQMIASPMAVWDWDS